MNEKVSLTLALSSSALLWTVLYFGSPWAAGSKKTQINEKKVVKKRQINDKVSFN